MNKNYYIPLTVTTPPVTTPSLSPPTPTYTQCVQRLSQIHTTYSVSQIHRTYIVCHKYTDTVQRAVSSVSICDSVSSTVSSSFTVSSWDTCLPRPLPRPRPLPLAARLLTPSWALQS